MAKELTTRTAQSVLVLERGIPRKTADYALDMDELDYAVRLRMMQNIADETITHRHAPGGTAAPVRQYGSFLPGSGVGGAGEHWNGAAWRFLPDVFTLRSHLNQKHGAGKLPADLAVQDVREAPRVLADQGRQLGEMGDVLVALPLGDRDHGADDDHGLTSLS